MNASDLQTRVDDIRRALEPEASKVEDIRLNKEIRVLEHLIQEGRAKALARRLAARAKRRLGW
jgi:hypothetical protein